MNERARRAISLYVMPAVALGILGWTATTDPPAPIMIFFIAALGWPLLGIARIEGEREALEWALSRALAESGEGGADG